MQFLIAFFSGAIVGSFLNVCIARLPKDESIVFPGSHCMACNHSIAWHDNIPVLSFFILGRKCRHCGTKISWQYATVEVLTAVLFVIFYATFGITAKGIFLLILSLALLVQALIDLKYQIIPDTITLPGMILGLAASAFFPELHGAGSWSMGLLRSFIGLLLGGGIFYLVGTIGEWILKKEAMGGGDVKLLAMIGAFLGWRGVLWTIFSSSLIGSIVGVILRIRGGEEKIPFGPFLALGAFFYIFFGEQTIHWYMTFIGII